MWELREGPRGPLPGPSAGAQGLPQGSRSQLATPNTSQHRTRGDNPASVTGSPQTQLYTESLRWQEKHNGKDKLKVAWQTLFSFLKIP